MVRSTTAAPEGQVPAPAFVSTSVPGRTPTRTRSTVLDEDERVAHRVQDADAVAGAKVFQPKDGRPSRSRPGPHQFVMGQDPLDAAPAAHHDLLSGRLDRRGQRVQLVVDAGSGRSVHGSGAALVGRVTSRRHRLVSRCVRTARRCREAVLEAGDALFTGADLLLEDLREATKAISVPGAVR